MNVNSCVVGGRLTADCEVRTSKDGLPIGNFRIAINGRNDDVTFLNVSFFGKSVDNISQYLTKGSLVVVNGRIKIDEYEKDGVKKQYTSIYADHVELGPRKEQVA